MAEYINKAELINYLEENILWTKRSWEDMTSVIDELPTIDIVHCSECIHAKLNWADGEYYCARHQDVFTKDYYCADGERFGGNNE